MIDTAKQSDNTVSESAFYMWRTLFALAHTDKVISDGEVRFMAEVLEDQPFSDAQKAVLNEDIKDAQDPVTMFSLVTETLDQAKFFKLAHEMVWADGDYGMEEQHIMLQLKEIHLKTAKVDDLVGHIELELDDDT